MVTKLSNLNPIARDLRLPSC